MTTAAASAIFSDIQSLSPTGIVTMYDIDATAQGGSVTRLHDGENELRANVVWQGNTYSAFPIEAEGFELSGKGALPRPTLRVANVTGLVGALVRSTNDLVGATVTRRRTFVKYLDAVNFTGGVNPNADPNAHFADEIYTVARKVTENKVLIEFELASALDVEGVQIPSRQVVANVCQWVYKSTECGYASGPVATIADVTTTVTAEDACGKRLTSCKFRFGTFGELPFGGFPGAGRVR